jgi:hypothetical protein
MHEDDGTDGLYEEIERRALFGLDADDDEAPPPDLIGSLRGDAPAEAADLTLGGYIEKHSRVPAFEGSDGQPYTVDVDVEERRRSTRHRSLHSSSSSAGPPPAPASWTTSSPATWHAGTEEDAARRAALELSLYEIKAELDAAIARRREALED